jgi:DNA modification methylase
MTKINRKNLSVNPLNIIDNLNFEYVKCETKMRFINGDSRNILPLLPDNYVDTVITSPPYGNLKNYGSEDQIGFGQDIYGEYLADIKKVLSELFRITKTGGTLWLIVDNIKSDHKGIPLPWEITQIATESGWQFQDFIVWDKGKSLPWTATGRFRNQCEFIILLSKGKIKYFNIDSVRESNSLSTYWVKYPERYNPNGKAPGDLWHFPIPVQGSWGNTPRHFCPFPIGLVERIVSISTPLDGFVLDPFAGTGSVPAVANLLGCYGIGVEINSEFCNNFDIKSYSNVLDQNNQDDDDIEGFYQKNIALRKNKIAKELFRKIIEFSRTDKLLPSIRLILVDNVDESDIKNNFGACKITFIIDFADDNQISEEKTSKIINNKMFQEFRIKCEVVFLTVHCPQEILEQIRDKTYYIYTSGEFNKERGQFDVQRNLDEIMIPTRGYPVILSENRINVDALK